MTKSTAPRATAAPIELGRLRAQWPILVCLAFFASGIVMASIGHWRRGSMLMGTGMGLAGAFRLVLPPRFAGLLVVRRRWFDVVLGVGMGAVMIVLAFLVPPSPPQQ